MAADQPPFAPRVTLDEVRAAREGLQDAARPQTVARQRKRNRWTAREGIAALADQASFVEYGGLVRPAMAGMDGAADGPRASVGRELSHVTAQPTEDPPIRW